MTRSVTNHHRLLREPSAWNAAHEKDPGGLTPLLLLLRGHIIVESCGRYVQYSPRSPSSPSSSSYTLLLPTLPTLSIAARVVVIYPQ